MVTCIDTTHTHTHINLHLVVLTLDWAAWLWSPGLKISLKIEIVCVLFVYSCVLPVYYFYGKYCHLRIIFGLQCLIMTNEVMWISKNKTWVEDLNYCRQKHYNLVSITNFHHQRCFQERAKNASTAYVWLGLCNTCTLDLWFWVSDNVVSYNNLAWHRSRDACDMECSHGERGTKSVVQILDNETFNLLCSKM